MNIPNILWFCFVSLFILIRFWVCRPLPPNGRLTKYAHEHFFNKWKKKKNNKNQKQLRTVAAHVGMLHETERKKTHERMAEQNEEMKRQRVSVVCVNQRGKTSSSW